MTGKLQEAKRLFHSYKEAGRRARRRASRPNEEGAQKNSGNKKVFAAGCGFYKLFWVFVLGSFYGDLVETVFVWINSGELMSRSSLVIGPFSLVWGIGCVLLTLFLHRMIDWEDRYIMIAGTVLGGAFEYICSVFTEKMFGAVFWDYSHMRFNLNGRINLLYCLFWGIMAVVWLKILYPWLSEGIEKLPVLFGKVLTWVLLLFFVFDISVSCAALVRMHQRDLGDTAPQTWAERYVDEHYTDEWIAKRYRNLKLVQAEGSEDGQK